MTEVKHTPGVWRVEQGTTLVWGACNQDDNSSHGMGYPIAEARAARPRWHGGNHMEEEAVANAHLIAAAPDMLAALKILVAQIQDYERVNNLAPNPGRSHCWDATVIAIDAIAKAEMLTSQQPSEGDQ